MTATTKWIEDVVAGGWLPKPDAVIIEVKVENGFAWVVYSRPELGILVIDLNQMLLRPDVWQAVGRTRGWVDVMFSKSVGKIEPGRPIRNIHRQDWKRKWHTFIDHLAEDLSIEDALKAIE